MQLSERIVPEQHQKAAPPLHTTPPSTTAVHLKARHTVRMCTVQLLSHCRDRNCNRGRICGNLSEYCVKMKPTGKLQSSHKLKMHLAKKKMHLAKKTAFFALHDMRNKNSVESGIASREDALVGRGEDAVVVSNEYDVVGSGFLFLA